MRTTPWESTPRALAQTRTSATVRASAGAMPFAEKTAVANRNSSSRLTRKSLMPMTPPGPSHGAAKANADVFGS